MSEWESANFSWCMFHIDNAPIHCQILWHGSDVQAHNDAKLTSGQLLISVLLMFVTIELLFARANFCLRVLSSPASVCVSVCACINHLPVRINNSGPVQAMITIFGPKVQNSFVKISIVLVSDWPWPLRSNLTSKSKFLFQPCRKYMTTT